MNPWPGGTLHGLGGFLKWTLLDRLTNPPPREPVAAVPVPTAAPDFGAPRAAPGTRTITWVGHSSFLIQLGALNVLTDPVWSERASPVSIAGPRRRVPPGIPFDALPPIDAVLISHDHYDHLDDATVRALVARAPGAAWFAPLGVGAWLAARGARNVIERDWWQSAELGDARVTCTPAQHFSGRGPARRNATLWCGWTLRSSSGTVHFAGDTGYFPEFERVGQETGPFDAVLLPIGAYDPRWFMRPVHMAPEETVRAYLELTRPAPGTHRTLMSAMHFGTFKLTDEPLDEPPRRTRAAWLDAGLEPANLWVPLHGETFGF
jgi:N-acyl-phosphatidylethanolamine-hydrolysing phospholipase D